MARDALIRVLWIKGGTRPSVEWPTAGNEGDFKLQNSAFDIKRADLSSKLDSLKMWGTLAEGAGEWGIRKKQKKKGLVLWLAH